MRPYVAHSICFTLEIWPDRKRPNFLGDKACSLPIPPPHTRHRRKWNISKFCWLREKRLCDTYLHTRLSSLQPGMIVCVPSQCVWHCLFVSVCWLLHPAGMPVCFVRLEWCHGNLNLKKKSTLCCKLKKGYFQWKVGTVQLHVGWTPVLKPVPWSRTIAGVLPAVACLSAQGSNAGPSCCGHCWTLSHWANHIHRAA